MVVGRNAERLHQGVVDGAAECVQALGVGTQGVDTDEGHEELLVVAGMYILVGTEGGWRVRAGPRGSPCEGAEVQESQSV
ncbi:hypothetical protein GCM10018785_06640 [Streptomyces longispororuber]|uniref:Uncharacterized protein n=1 Tax=Streptomyces longispororuber TaxID=68230 RepID=A0A918Z7Z7_9ACTN|nr:hypothetical protein GCM10018785_06640 [Streptomyces longispororuber]